MSKKILVCNPEHAFLREAVKHLREWGYQVVVAEDGDQAVHEAHHERPDLILLDVDIPAGGIAGVHRHLTMSIDTEFIPVILVADMSERELASLAEHYQAAGYIAEEYDPNILHAKIQSIFGDEDKYSL